MGKYSNDKKYYNKDWEQEAEFKGWLTGTGRREAALCKLCHQELRAHKTDLLRHKATNKHKEKEKGLQHQPKLQYAPVDVANPLKKFDIILAVHIATHSSMRTIDHLSEILNYYCRDNDTSKGLQLHRTKCSSIIMNVLEPALKKELLKDIGEESFSIILDESTDTSQFKFMAYCIRYFNKKLNKIIVDFLGLQIVEKATAEILSENFITFLSDFGLNMENLIAIATDGANNLCGKNHSLFTILKQKFPKLQLLKCICHSLAICSQKSAEELPSNLEFLLRETRNWFSHSPLRIHMYEELYKKLNSGKKPPKLTQLSATRWLSFHKAIQQNIDQWNDLKNHFVSISKENIRSNNCYVTRLLTQMYEDNSNYLYLLFLNSVLGEVNKINLIFQSNNVNIIDAYHDLRLMIMSIARRIFKPTFLKTKVNTENFTEIIVAELQAIQFAVLKIEDQFGNSLLPDDAIDYGYDFLDFLSTSHISQQQLIDIRARCRSFLIRLLKELIMRMPANFNIIQKLSSFKPINCLGFSGNISTDMLPWDLLPNSYSKQNILNQLAYLNNLKIQEIFPNDEIKDLKSVNIVKFWSGVLELKNALGEPICEELAKFALKCLSLPISNAVVERVFSIMNIVKTKLRNKMGIQMLSSILRTRLFLSVRNICCNKFEPTPQMYLLHNNNMYNREKNNESVDENELMEEVITLYASDYNYDELS